MNDVQLLVNRNDLSDYRWATSDISGADLAVGQVLLSVDEFALTANNITYAVAGDSMGYWQFFPVAQPAREGWGRIPVWGFATVVDSANDAIAVGERLYGYLPMGSHLVIDADRVAGGHLVDNAPHRRELPAVYNQLQRVKAKPDATAEAIQMLYRPLYMTSFILDDFLDHNDFFGATDVLLTSASSKTSIGLAFLLAQRTNCRVFGLTSTANMAFVASLGCYDEVVDYDAIETLDREIPTVIVDMAGNGSALAAVHNHFRDQLKYSCLVGATHWQARSGARDMAGPKPELFFAPNHIKARSQEWGPGGLESRFEGAWDAFTSKVGDWIQVRRGAGQDQVGQVYESLLAGRATPDVGHVLTVRS